MIPVHLLTSTSRRNSGKLAAAEFAKQMLHMPGVVHPPSPFSKDAFQMAKANDDFHNFGE
jgi:hypothetical protein